MHSTFKKIKYISTKAFILGAVTFGAVGCSGIYQDSVQAPTEQEIAKLRALEPKSVLRQGVFHIQQTQTRSPVRIDQEIRLKRPELPPFDVAYVRQSVEDVLIELANTAGESVVIPSSLRNKTVTLIHAGSDFKGLLGIVLAKVGYHYNYIDGVWYITKFPVRNYQLEVSQAMRGGSLQTSLEPERIEDDAETEDSSTSGEELDTSYEDELWAQVSSTLQELISVGSDVTSTPLAPPQLEAPNPNDNDLTGEVAELAPEVGFGGNSNAATVRPRPIRPVRGGDHLAAEDLATPFYRVTRSAGLITVRAAPEAHRMIEEYLEQVQQSLLRQIFVEARILAIVRDKTTARGGGLGGSGLGADGVSLGNIGGRRLGTRFGFDGSSGLPLNADTGSADLGGFLNFSFNNNSIQGVVQLLNQIGDVYTISSPSLLARNNQISRVAITQQIGYVETSVETNVNSSGDVTIGQRTDEARFRNVGTVFSIIPFIGKNKVQMRMRLSLSNQSGEVAINTSVGEGEPVSNNVPEISTNLVDQDMVMDYGRVHAVGAVVQATTELNEAYVPGFNQVPGLRDVFSSARNQKTNTEFVVLMKVSRS